MKSQHIINLDAPCWAINYEFWPLSDMVEQNLFLYNDDFVPQDKTSTSGYSGLYNSIKFYTGKELATKNVKGFAIYDMDIDECVNEYGAIVFVQIAMSNINKEPLQTAISNAEKIDSTKYWTTDDRWKVPSIAKWLLGRPAGSH